MCRRSGGLSDIPDLALATTQSRAPGIFQGDKVHVFSMEWFRKSEAVEANRDQF